jgi:hypothetical protein
MVDLDTDESFDEFNREVLSKGVAGVPSAYKDGERCEIILNKEGNYGYRRPAFLQEGI